jgi:hypothetical protein
MQFPGFREQAGSTVGFGDGVQIEVLLADIPLFDVVVVVQCGLEGDGARVVSVLWAQTVH